MASVKRKRVDAQRRARGLEKASRWERRKIAAILTSFQDSGFHVNIGKGTMQAYYLGWSLAHIGCIPAKTLEQTLDREKLEAAGRKWKAYVQS